MKELKSYKDIMPILKEIKKDIAKILNTNDFELIVFGSYARGEAREDSDLDLLLVTNKDISFEEEMKILELIDKKFNYVKLVHLVILKNEEFNENTINPFLVKNIKREGVKI